MAELKPRPFFACEKCGKPVTAPQAVAYANQRIESLNAAWNNRIGNGLILAAEDVPTGFWQTFLEGGEWPTDPEGWGRLIGRIAQATYKEVSF